MFQAEEAMKYQVACFLCEKLHKVMMDEPKEGKAPSQGLCCDTSTVRATTGEIYLMCAYGSSYDCDCFLITDAALAKSLLRSKDYPEVTGGNVCDDCIMRRVGDGHLLPIESRGIEGAAYPITPLKSAWPHKAYVPTKEGDELWQAHRRIVHLEHELVDLSSHSAYRALLKGHNEMVQAILKFDPSKPIAELVAELKLRIVN